MPAILRSSSRCALDFEAAAVVAAGVVADVEPLPVNPVGVGVDVPETVAEAVGVDDDVVDVVVVVAAVTVVMAAAEAAVAPPLDEPPPDVGCEFDFGVVDAAAAAAAARD